MLLKWDFFPTGTPVTFVCYFNILYISISKVVLSGFETQFRKILGFEPNTDYQALSESERFGQLELKCVVKYCNSAEYGDKKNPSGSYPGCFYQIEFKLFANEFSS